MYHVCYTQFSNPMLIVMLQSKQKHVISSY